MRSHVFRPGPGRFSSLLFRVASPLVLLGALCAGLTALPAQAQVAKRATDLVQDRLQTHIRALADSALQGRGPGSAGLDVAADYITEAFRSAGLSPGAEDGSWIQSFTPAEPPAGSTASEVAPAGGKSWSQVTLKNIVGVLPGTAGEEAPCVLVGAHYDHLGTAPDGRIYPGADDNASGVAVLLELALQLSREGPYRNTIVLAAFSGEEAGTLGSRYYAEHPACPLTRTTAMLNLDTVGRMEGKSLTLFGSGTAAEFQEMLNGINMGRAMDLVLLETGAFASDQTPFFEKGIPVLHFFSGPNSDYHRVTDVESKINYDGLFEILEFVDETVIYLAERETKLTFVPPGAAKLAPPSIGTGAPRRVSLGTIPDFSRESGGVLLSGVMPGSPAEGAGFKKGDLLTSVAGLGVDNLADFSAALKNHQPGDTVEVVGQRGAEEIRRKVCLVERK